MDLLDSLPRFAVALGIGLLIGLERGWHTREMEPGTRAAGIRTFTISSLLGATAGALARAITDVGFFPRCHFSGILGHHYPFLLG